MSELSKRLRGRELRDRRRRVMKSYVERKSDNPVVDAFVQGQASIEQLYDAWADDALTIVDYARVFPELIDRLLLFRHDGTLFLIESAKPHDNSDTRLCEKCRNLWVVDQPRRLCADHVIEALQNAAALIDSYRSTEESISDYSTEEKP